jgi:asparagine synthase (glutamine-hydrolysing)
MISDVLQAALPLCPSGLLPGRLRRLKRLGWTGFLAEKEERGIAAAASAFGWSQGEILAQSEGYLQLYREGAEAAQFRRFTDYVTWRNLYFSGWSPNFLMPDISGMQAQVEVRSPFLDWRFIQQLAAIPDSLRVGSYFSDRRNKAVLKRFYAGQLGRDLAYGPKRGMGMNIRWDMWMVHERPVRDFVERSLRLLGGYGIDPRWFLERFSQHCRDPRPVRPEGGQAVTGLMLALWLKKHHDGFDSLQEWMAPLVRFQPQRSYPD